MRIFHPALLRRILILPKASPAPKCLVDPGRASCSRVEVLGHSQRPAEPDSWKGKFLLVESEDDVFPESTRAALRALYPRANVHRFGQGAGHSPSVTREAEYGRMLEEFLELGGVG
jgi:hypothetical protein